MLGTKNKRWDQFDPIVGLYEAKVPNSDPIWENLDMTLGQTWVQINPTMGLNVV